MPNIEGLDKDYSIGSVSGGGGGNGNAQLIGQFLSSLSGVASDIAGSMAKQKKEEVWGSYVDRIDTIQSDTSLNVMDKNALIRKTRNAAAKELGSEYIDKIDGFTRESYSQQEMTHTGLIIKDADGNIVGHQYTDAVYGAQDYLAETQGNLNSAYPNSMPALGGLLAAAKASPGETAYLAGRTHEILQNQDAATSNLSTRIGFGTASRADQDFMIKDYNDKSASNLQRLGANFANETIFKAVQDTSSGVTPQSVAASYMSLASEHIASLSNHADKAKLMDDARTYSTFLESSLSKAATWNFEQFDRDSKAKQMQVANIENEYKLSDPKARITDISDLKNKEIEANILAKGYQMSADAANELKVLGFEGDKQTQIANALGRSILAAKVTGQEIPVQRKALQSALYQMGGISSQIQASRSAGIAPTRAGMQSLVKQIGTVAASPEAFTQGIAYWTGWVKDDVVPAIQEGMNTIDPNTGQPVVSKAEGEKLVNDLYQIYTVGSKITNKHEYIPDLKPVDGAPMPSQPDEGFFKKTLQWIKDFSTDNSGNNKVARKPLTNPKKSGGLSSLIISDANAEEVITKVSAAHGNDPELMTKIAQRESRLGQAKDNPSAGSAKGLFQFNDATWASVVNKYGKENGLTMDGVKDKKQNTIAANLLLSENRAMLVKELGREPADAELYLAHLLGSFDVRRFLNALGTDKTVDKIIPAAAKANKAVFYHDRGKGKPKTPEEVYTELAAEFE